MALSKKIRRYELAPPLKNLINFTRVRRRNEKAKSVAFENLLCLDIIKKQHGLKSALMR